MKWAGGILLVVLAVVVGYAALRQMHAASTAAPTDAAPVVSQRVPILVRPIPDCADAIGASPIGQECVPAALKDVPPDPGPEGASTPAGVDRNNNGVRDDIERWIAASYPESATLRAGLMQYARSQQIYSARRMNSPAEALAVSARTSRAIACMVLTLGQGDAADAEASRRFRAMQQLDLQFLNTPERLKLFIENEKLLAGQVLESPEGSDPAKYCDFDASKLPD
jgi:hypothetical protein